MKAKISGIKNPLLTVIINNYEKDDKVKVYVDNKKIDISEDLTDNDEFIVKAVLPKNCKNVLVKVLNNEEVIYTKKLRNSLINKVIDKVYSLFYTIFHKLFLIIKLLFMGIKRLWKDYHFLVPPKMWKVYYQGFKKRLKTGNSSFAYNPLNPNEYRRWIKNCEVIDPYEKQDYEPLISILIPVYNIGKKYLSECLDSILNQTYQNFEIILVDDCSTKEETKETLKEYALKDKRITVKYRLENGHISKATNDALELAKGEFIGLVDNDDVLRCDALACVVKVLNQDKKIDMIYSDEDKLDLNGNRCDPNFKPDFAIDTLLSSNYICHFTVLRTSIVKKIGGFRVGYEGAQDYDLFLRFTENTSPSKIYHLPKILYHWRMVEGSTSMVIDNKNYALERGKKALEDALKRRKIEGIVHICSNCPYYYIEYTLKKQPKIEIIIPTKDFASTLDKCLKSIYEKTTYDNYSVTVINNNSCLDETFALFKKYQEKYSNFKVIDANIEFNYSKLNNMAVLESKADYVLLLNNDIEVITPNWLELMVGYAAQEHIGAVGAKLIYPDNTVQHAGVIVGLGGVAGHAYTNFKRDAVVWGGRLSVPYNYSAVTAACLMVKRTKYNEVKGLEEQLKVAFNDIDFCLKLVSKGYYNVCLPMVELYHYESKSIGSDNTSAKQKRFLSEISYMHNKWGESLIKDRFYNPNLSLRACFMLDKRRGNKNEKQR